MSWAAKPRLSAAIVEGIAVITEGNPISARDSAIKNAMRIAVEDIVLNSVKEEGLEIYKESLEDNIYKNCEDFIQSYKMLAEMQNEDTYSVTLQMNIFVDSIKKRLISLGISVVSHDTPRILLIIEEKTGVFLAEENFLMLYSISEDAISKKLTEGGFEVIDRNAVRNKIDIKEIRKGLSGDIHIASAIGKYLNADVVILGAANVKAEIGEIKAEINTKVFSVKREALIVERNEVTTVLTTDKILGTAQSLRNAVDKIIPVLIDFIKKGLTEDGGQRVDMVW